MTISLIKNIASFKDSSDELMKYKVSKEKLRDQIVKLGLDGFMRKYAGYFIYGYNASQMVSLYSKDNQKFPSSYWLDRKKLNNYMLPSFTKKVVQYLEKN